MNNKIELPNNSYLYPFPIASCLVSIPLLVAFPFITDGRFALVPAFYLGLLPVVITWLCSQLFGPLFFKGKSLKKTSAMTRGVLLLGLSFGMWVACGPFAAHVQRMVIASTQIADPGAADVLGEVLLPGLSMVVILFITILGALAGLVANHLAPKQQFPMVELPIDAS